MDSEFYRGVFIYPIPSICDDHLSCRNTSYILRPEDSPGTYNAAADVMLVLLEGGKASSAEHARRRVPGTWTILMAIAPTLETHSGYDNK